ncbi:uncharacterized protein LOC117328355 [Pecten maximus]|uniref:uncharacterized protein LOC117328355 n=1 Tax=Pecten maximus TaxID=6579 RepID=UPI001457F0D9|nr:uncharacterized protein LOC117328355 [Pecten maximus]
MTVHSDNESLEVQRKPGAALPDCLGVKAVVWGTFEVCSYGPHPLFVLIFDSLREDTCFLSVAELKAVEGNEENEEGNVQEGACGGDNTSHEDSVDVILEGDQTNTESPLVSPDVRIIIAPYENNSKIVEFENTDKSGNRESYVKQFLQFGLVSFIFKTVIFSIKVNNTLKKYSGYVAVLDVHALQTFFCSLIERERNGSELNMEHKHMLDIIRKTAILDVVESKNGAPILSKLATNTASPINSGALSCLLKVLVTYIMSKLGQFYNRLGFLPIFLTNLRPVLVGIGSAQSIPSMDISDIWSFLNWPDSTSAATAKDLYTQGFRCLDSTRNLIHCLSCGNTQTCQHQVPVCCSPRRILRFEGPISLAEMNQYVESLTSVFEHSPLPHFGQIDDSLLRDNFLTSSMPSDVERFIESKLFPIDDAGIFECFFCGVRLGNWQESHDAVLRHAAVSLHCQYILKLCGPAFIYFLRESLLQAGMDLTGYIRRHFTCHPEYRLRSAREQTWKRSSLNEERQSQWSDAGFYFMDPHCRSFCCGIKIADFRESDDPWSVHFGFRPNCPFLLKNRPEYFAVRAGCLQLTGEQMRRFAVASGQDNEATNGIVMLRVDGILDGIVTSSFSETENVQLFNDDPPQVQAPMDDPPQAQASMDDPPQVQAPMDDPPQVQAPVDEELKRIQEENEELKQRLYCGICEENEVAILFLPCYHILCCAECAPACKVCPSCQSRITGVAKIYLS